MADWIDLVDKKKLIRNILQILDKHINASSGYSAELFEIKRELLGSIDIEQSFFTQDSGNRWISCEERLPEVYEEVLTYNYEGIIHDNFRLNLRDGLIGWSHGWGITHWQPRPEPPKGGADNGN